MEHLSALSSWHLNGKKVVVRVDFNVPIAQGRIIDDFRIRAALPTLDYILADGGTVILLTHIGRPEDKDTKLSTQCIQKWFINSNYVAYFAPTLADAHTLANKHPNSIIVVENLRFFSGEQSKNKSFAQEIASLGEYYINDAFGSMHRDDTSIALVPHHYPADKKTIGFLTEKELAFLDDILQHPKPPFVVILGGSKIADKIPLLKNMIDHANTVLLCPAMVFTFKKALGKPVGKSLVDDSQIKMCLEIIDKAAQQSVTLELPSDYLVAHNTIEGTLSTTQHDTIANNEYGIAIGPKTIQRYVSIIETAGTIFFNGSMGFANRKETMQATYLLLKAMAQSRGTTIVAGGDSVSAAQASGFGQAIDHLSTGGGATLAYLSGEPLIGLLALNN